jgi:hypothetical protein
MCCCLCDDELCSSNPRAADFFVDEVIGELTREADINAVFFDETDSEYANSLSCARLPRGSSVRRVLLLNHQI